MSSLEEMLAPRNDLGDYWGPIRAFCIASVPRSGSTLLGRYLRDTGLAGDPREYLEANQVAILARRFGQRPGQRAQSALLRAVGRPVDRWWSAEDYVLFLHRLARYRTTANGRFGIKAHHRQLHRALLSRGLRLERVFGPVHYVRIRRSDLEAAAVSWYRAAETQQFSSEFRPQRPEPRYDYEKIEDHRRQLVKEDEGWSTFFASTGQPFHAVEFDELVREPERVVREVLRWLELPADVPIRAPSIEKQSSDAARELLERYRRDRRAR